MKTYYIPTTSLNFSNILSSESISPKAFYEKRGFGSPHWLTVEWNKFDNITLLYDKPFHFDIPKGDLEDHPLMIEIQSKEEFPELQDGIFYTDRTIYLNPWNTKMYFFSQEAKTAALSISDIDLDVKMLRLYERRIEIRTFQAQGIVPNEQKASAIPLNERAIEDDMRINKLKGMLYGYYIGAYLSSEKDDVATLRELREVRNIFASILSDEKKKPTHQQDERLTELFDSLNRSTPLHKSLAEFLPEEQIQKVYAAYKEHLDCESDAYFKDSLLEDLRNDVPNGENGALKFVDDKLKYQFALMKSARRLPNVDNSQIDVKDYPTVRISEEAVSKDCCAILNKWINDVLIRKDVNGELSSYNSKLADELTRNTRDLLAERWENSEERKFLNNMRNYIGGKDVEIAWGNDLFSSLTAVLVKGNEWDECLKFMQGKVMTDYRLAFALYGVIHGFANLSRDFTDQLLDKESQYIGTFYKEFHRQLHKEEIETPKTIVEQPKAIVQKGYSSLYPLNPTQHSPNSNPQDKKREIFTFAEQTLKDKKKSLNKNDEQILTDLMNAKQEFGEITEATLGQFFYKLQQREGWHRKDDKPIELLKKMREHFGIAETAKKKPLPKALETPTLPLGNTYQYTLPELQSLADLDPLARSRCAENWNWVFPQHIGNMPDTINHFVNRCKQESRGEKTNDKSLLGKFDDEMGRRVKAELYKYYGIRED